jgi:hypothetical protein
MPSAILRSCRRPGCRAYATAGGHCLEHQPAARAEVTATRAQLDATRGSAHARGYDGKWAALSRTTRARFPLSSGYLTRSAYWHPAGAAVFDGLREQAASLGRTLEFSRMVAAAWGEAGALALPAPLPSGLALGAQLAALRSALLALPPLYHFHASPRVEPAEVTDHIIPHQGDPGLFWAQWNLQTLSKRQHDEKTATYDGGFRGSRSA